MRKRKSFAFAHENKKSNQKLAVHTRMKLSTLNKKLFSESNEDKQLRLRCHILSNNKTTASQDFMINEVTLEQDEYENKYCLFSFVDDFGFTDKNNDIADMRKTLKQSHEENRDIQFDMYVRMQDGNIAKVLDIQENHVEDGDIIVLGVQNTNDLETFKDDVSTFMTANIIQNLVFAAIGIIAIFFFPFSASQIGLPIRFGDLSTFLMLVLATIFTLVVTLSISLASSSLFKRVDKKGYFEALRKQRQGIMGIVFQQSNGWLAVFFGCVGVGEEYLFRAALINFIFAFLSMFASQGIALLIACILSIAIFAAAHLPTNKNAWSMSSIVLLGTILTITYVVTGSIVPGAIAHGAYDFIIVLLQKWRRVKEGNAKYFFGKRPLDLSGDYTLVFPCESKDSQ